MSDLVTIRASQLGIFPDCPARGEAIILRGLYTPSGPRAEIGKALHKSTAVYDQSVIDGSGLTVDDAAGAAVDSIHRPESEVLWDDMQQEKAEEIALSLHRRYCTEVAPKQTYAAVEVTCDRLEIADLGLALTGTTDRVRASESGHGIVDIKSGRTAVGADGTVPTKGHAYQLGVYELLAERGSGLEITEPALIVGAQTGLTEKGRRVAVSHPITGARDALLGEEGSPGVLEAVAGMIRSGTFIGNPNSKFCHTKYCPIYKACRFRR
ncbi:MAG TPA: PD-(D/E)XK nuclease family protein [Methylomirabilota bacterium]